MSTLLFVYGTLKRGGMNHAQLASEKFIATAQTQPGYRLYDVGSFPGLVPDATAQHSIAGELWEVSDAGLARLDCFEGVAENLFTREAIPLAPPFDHRAAQGYIYARSVAGLKDLGTEWRE
jgi:gamma-glutamylaminecyclotransferase